MKLREMICVKSRKIFPILILLMSFIYSSEVFAVTSSYAGNFALPEAQSGYAEERYEAKCFQKLQRGAENFFLGFLEIPQGIKSERASRKAEYLPVGLESFFIGTLRGIGNGAKRMAVGFYEGVTFVYAQDPILEEMSDWAY